jgi:2'-5' RNA ligase
VTAGGDVPPLVLTLQLDEAAQERFDALRRAHFPPERNRLQAHVTLFHALPGEHEEPVRSDLEASAQRPAYDVDVVRVRSLGRGVAYDLRSPELRAQRADLARRWQPWLTPQDARPHAPHVTVQNMVPPERARALLQQLQAGFAPYAVRATGLALWRYLGGPWEPLGSYRFSPAPTG